MTLFFILFLISIVCATDVKHEGNLLFTSDIYKQIKNLNSGNILVSPLSLKIVLAMIEKGAKGSTAEELRKILHFSKDKTEVEFQDIFSDLKTSVMYPEGYLFNFANKIYLQKNLTTKDEFKQIVKNVFSTDLENVNFTNKKETANYINKWVEKQTRNNIHNIISASNLEASTKMIIVNALYFLADWEIPFFQQTTFKKEFFVTKEKSVMVQMMHEVLTLYKYVENSELDAKFLEMSFSGKIASMVFVLPNEIDGLDKLENKIDSVFAPQKFEWHCVNVSIPKFKFENTLDVKTVLTKLGVTKAFSPGQADFSGISNRNIVMDNIIQKSFIDLTEKGVEAGSSSYIRTVEYSGSGAPDKLFKANHPFIFYIKIKDAIVFVGRVLQP